MKCLVIFDKSSYTLILNVKYEKRVNYPQKFSEMRRKAAQHPVSTSTHFINLNRVQTNV